RIDNSPVAASEVDLGSRTPVLITTNGTQALLAAAACAPEVLLASFVDLYAVARHLAESATTRVLLMPAGQVARGEACVEDDLCADALAALLAGREPDLQAASRIIRADPLVRQRIEVEPCFGIDLEVALAPQPSQRALQFEALGRGVGHILRVA
ncbi:MAG: 2-phosphosulfolactate phosphatase, partial [Myxococcales bacterium]|nr:2-phosphosulfolactate phosphatase [Myxococcales bacterium]